jgi:hypothetical protein
MIPSPPILPPDSKTSSNKPIFSYQGIFEQIESPYPGKFEQHSSTCRRVAFDLFANVIITETTILGGRKIKILTEDGQGSMNVIAAFHKTTGRLQWWKPLKEGFLRNIKTPHGMLMIYADKKKAPLLDIETGQPSTFITLPQPVCSPFDKVCITPMGTCYFITRIDLKRTLCIGSVTEKTWAMKQTPPGFVHFYGEFACFKFPGQKEQVIIDKSGRNYRFTRCPDITIVDKILYRVIKEPASPNHMILSAQKIADSDRFRLQAPVGSIRIPSENIQVIDFLKDGLCLILDQNKNPPLLKLIDIKTGIHRNLQRIIPFHSKCLADAKSNTVWCLTDDKILWKHGINISSIEAKLESAGKTRLLHVDEQNCLYAHTIP